MASLRTTLVLAATLISPLGLIGCGSGIDDEKDDSDTDATTTTTTTTNTVPDSDVDHRLTVVNGCEKDIWIAHIAANEVGPDAQDIRIPAGDRMVFQTSTDGGGLSATRFWPKMGCDDTGNNCAIGDSGGPGEGCVIRVPGKPDDYSKCAPPIDSKFEATFAPSDAPTRDTVDMSLVDGYSLPFKLEVSDGKCTRDGEPFKRMDCSDLTLERCPKAETLNGQEVDLRAVHPSTGEVVGCFSPCMKLVDDKWGSSPVAPDSAAAGPYCCAGKYGTPDTCNAGPIVKTEFLESKNEHCPHAYGYAYDDKVATIVCETSTKYSVTYFCPSTLTSGSVLM